MELAAHTAAGTAGVTVYVGHANTGHTEALVVAAVIVVVLAYLLFGIRRYAAASNIGADDPGLSWPLPTRLAYAAWPWAKPWTTKNLTAPKTHGILVGTDGRTSTSKTTAAPWTVVVLYFFVALALVLGFDRIEFDALIGGTSPIYLIFLGGPFAAAVLAKATVNNAEIKGTLQRSNADAPRVADVFSDDEGNTDLVDLQYIAFNLVVMSIVLVQFLHQPGAGPPPVPDILAGLTSASAATYVVNKALVTGSGNPPSINQIVPSPARPGRGGGGTRLRVQRSRIVGHRPADDHDRRHPLFDDGLAADSQSGDIPFARRRRPGSGPCRADYPGRPVHKPAESARGGRRLCNDLLVGSH